MALPFQAGQGNSISDANTAALKNKQDFGGAHVVFGNDNSNPPLAPQASGAPSIAIVGGLSVLGLVVALLIAKRK